MSFVSVLLPKAAETPYPSGTARFGYMEFSLRCTKKNLVEQVKPKGWHSLFLSM